VVVRRISGKACLIFFRVVAGKKGYPSIGHGEISMAEVDPESKDFSKIYKGEVGFFVNW
jgi:hypothetical protein